MAFTGNIGPAGLNPQEAQLYSAMEQHFNSPLEPMTTRIKGAFLSDMEAQFLLKLKRHHPESHVLCQVQLIRVVNIDVQALVDEWEKGGRDPSGFPDIKGQITDVNLLSLDFVLLDRSDVPYLVIELDGDEHRYDADVMKRWVKLQGVAQPGVKDKQEVIDRVNGWTRDRIKESAVTSAGIPFLRFRNDQVHSAPDFAALSEQIDRHFFAKR